MRPIRPTISRRPPTSAKRLLLKRRFQKFFSSGRLRVLAAIAAIGTGVLLLFAFADTSAQGNAVRQLVFAATARFGFAVDRVDLAGRHMTSREDVLQALGVSVGMPILSVPVDKVRERLDALPWVRTAAVERRLPNRLFVELTERQPLALWQRNGKLVLIDSDGVVVLSEHLEPYGNLPMVVGNDAPKHTTDLLKILNEQPDLAKRITSAVWVEGRRWDLHLDNGIVVKLPDTNAADAWNRLADIERNHAILVRDIVSVDLRLADRVVVTPSFEPAQPAAGKPTKQADHAT